MLHTSPRWTAFALDREVALLCRDGQTFFPYRFHVRGPLVYQRNVVSRFGQIPADYAANRSNSKNRYSVEHISSSLA